MTSLRDQFSAVRKAQFEAQFDFFHSMSTQALESVGRVAALNMAVSRDAVQRSLGASFALMNSRDPRDVLSFGGQAEEQMRSLFAYGRELLGIASGMRPYAVRPQALSHATEQAIETVEVIERSVADTAAEAASAAAEPVQAAVAAPVQATEAPESSATPATEAVADIAAETTPALEPAHAVSTIAPVSEPVVAAESAPAPEALAVEAEPVPVAEPKAIVKAVGKGAARAAAVPHPVAAPVDAPPSDDSAEMPKIETRPNSSRRKK